MTQIFLLMYALSPPTIADVPNDDGSKVLVKWESVEGATLVEIWRDSKINPGWAKVITYPSKLGSFQDVLPDSIRKGEVRYMVKYVMSDTLIASPPSKWLKTKPSWFNTGMINVLIGVILLGGVLLYYIYSAKAGKKIFIRRIPGLDALEEAVGRATEMGKPILYVFGSGSVSSISNLAALNILGEVAKKTATYETPLINPHRDPILYTVAREVVRESYTKVGKPDAFNPDSVFFVTNNQFAFTSAVNGIMVREKPATNIFAGYFYAESLILAEVGASTGAIQLAASDSTSQLPFFITACDYTMIGEELYAASAYLSDDPMLRGGLKGQDVLKLIVIGGIVVATILALTGLVEPSSIFKTTGM